MTYNMFLLLSSTTKRNIDTLILWQNTEIKRVMSTFCKTFSKQFHFLLTLPWLLHQISPPHRIA